MVVVRGLPRQCLTRPPTIHLKTHHRACIVTEWRYLLLPLPPRRLSPRLHMLTKKSSRVGGPLQGLGASPRPV